MIKLLINGLSVDITGKEDIGLDFALFSIEDISTRKGSRSYKIKLRKTVNNRLLFENPDDVNTLSIFPYRRFEARILVDGIDQGIRFGLLESSNDFYNIRVYGDNADIFNDLKDRLLSDLDLSIYNHIWDFSTVVGSRSATVGYIYPLIDWFAYSPVLEMDNLLRRIYANYMLPAFYLKTVLNKMFSERGFTLIDTLQDSEKLILPTTKDRAVILPASKYDATFRQTTNIALNDYRLEITQDNSGPGGFSIGQYVYVDNGTDRSEGRIYNIVGNKIYIRAITHTPPPLIEVIPPVTGFAPPNNLFNQGDDLIGVILSVVVMQINAIVFSKPNAIVTYSGSYYVVPYALTTLTFEDYFSIRLNLVLNLSNANNTDGVLRVYVKTGAMAYIGIAATITVPPGNSTHNVTVRAGDILASTVITPVTFELLHAPDTLLVSYNIINGANITILNTSTLEVDSQIDGTEEQPLVYGARIQASAILPRMKQSTLLKAYLQMFALLPVTNYEDKTVTLIKFFDIISNITNAVDWSAKIDMTEAPEVSFVFEDYAQENTFKYAEEDGEIKPTGTDGTLYIDNDNLEKEKNIITLPFSATEEVIRMDGLKLNRIGVFAEDKFSIDKNPRILYIDKKAGASLPPSPYIPAQSYQVEYRDFLGSVQSVTSDLPFTYFIQTGKVLNLGFSDNLLPVYYNVLNDVLERCKRIELQIRLNAEDINKLDFTKPVYLKYYNAYFYISAIIGYKPNANESTTVELVKLF